MLLHLTAQYGIYVMGAIILSNIVVYALAKRRKRTVPDWFGWGYGVVMLAIGGNAPNGNGIPHPLRMRHYSDGASPPRLPRSDSVMLRPFRRRTRRA